MDSFDVDVNVDVGMDEAVFDMDVNNDGNHAMASNLGSEVEAGMR